MNIHNKSSVLVIRWEPRERGERECALVRACLAGLAWISRVAVNIMLSFRLSMIVEMLNAGVNEFSHERLRTDTVQ